MPGELELYWMSETDKPRTQSEPTPPDSPPKGLPEATLVLITIIWGSNFFITQVALRETRPLGFLACRFTIAAVALFILFPRRIIRLRRLELRAGLLIGLTLFAAYVPQTIGLLYIPVAKSAFIIALYVPLVPVLQLVLLAKAPRLVVWVGIVLAVIGLFLLSADDGLEVGFGVGDWLTVGAAVACALQIILLGRWASITDPLQLAFIQIVVVAALCLAALPVVDEPLPALTPTVIAAASALGVVGTAFVLAAMNWAQRTVSPARATVIYATEPVWAAMIGMLAGQWMTTMGVLGSLLILLGVLVSEIRATR
jgi:drug/metabolite transporter (DMT)-like permease